MPEWLWHGLLFLGIGLIPSFVMGVFFYLKSKQTKELVWAIWTARIANTYTNQESGLCLTFEGHPVSSLAVSWVAVWNAGRTAISESDLTANNPVRIVTTRGARILSAEAVAVSDPGSLPSLTLREEGKAAEVCFSYLNHRHGIVISLVHSGSSPVNLSMTGAVIGGAPIRQVSSFGFKPKSIPSFVVRDDPRRQLLSRPRAILLVYVGLLIAVLSWLIWQGNYEWAFNAFMFWLLSPIVALATADMFLGVGSTVLRQLPIGLDELDDERTLPEFWGRM